MKWFPWILGLIVVLIGFVGAYSGSDLYSLFPLLGVWMWSIMWTHYIIGEVRRINPLIPFDSTYHNVSSTIVLLFLFLHPGLLAIAQFQNNMGLPLNSFYTYAGPPLSYAITLALCAWLGFISFEFFIRMKRNRYVNAHWWIVNLIQSIAMIFIFIHSLSLGRSLQNGWFRDYWIMLGIMLLICLIHQHINDAQRIISSSRNKGKGDPQLPPRETKVPSEPDEHRSEDR